VQRQVLIAESEKAVAVRLLADAEAALDRDLRQARRCLRRLAALIEAPSPPANAAAWLMDRRRAADGDADGPEADGPEAYANVADGREAGGVAGGVGAGIVRGGLAPWQLRRVERCVEAGLDAPITVADLAGEVRLSEGHFCRGFKVSTGETPHGFIVRRRLARAQHLMLTTDEPLSQVAMLCGMSDQAHLTRLFRRHLGTTPLTWRRTYRQEG
tara:strand:+ start:537 stop:1178 length:642 start_codon:yes stop_codon:yes gene_type:complete